MIAKFIKSAHGEIRATAINLLDWIRVARCHHRLLSGCRPFLICFSWPWLVVALSLIIGKGVDCSIFPFVPLFVDFQSLVVVVEVGTVDSLLTLLLALCGSLRSLFPPLSLFFAFRFWAPDEQKMCQSWHIASTPGVIYIGSQKVILL